MCHLGRFGPNDQRQRRKEAATRECCPKFICKTLISAFASKGTGLHIASVAKPRHIYAGRDINAGVGSYFDGQSRNSRVS